MPALQKYTEYALIISEIRKNEQGFTAYMYDYIFEHMLWP